MERHALASAGIVAARGASDPDCPGYRLYRLKGDLTGYWSPSISGSWRMIFDFEGSGPCGVDLVDYLQPDTGLHMSILSTYHPDVSIKRRHIDILG